MPMFARFAGRYRQVVWRPLGLVSPISFLCQNHQPPRNKGRVFARCQHRAINTVIHQGHRRGLNLIIADTRSYGHHPICRMYQACTCDRDDIVISHHNRWLAALLKIGAWLNGEFKQLTPYAHHLAIAQNRLAWLYFNLKLFKTASSSMARYYLADFIFAQGVEPIYLATGQ